MWAAYVSRFGEGLTQREVGDIAEVDQATVGRWLRGDKIPTDATVVTKLARGFERNPLEAFVAVGYLTIEEADLGLSPASRKLLTELQRSIEARAARAKSEEVEGNAFQVAARELYRMREEGAILGPRALHTALNNARKDVGLATIPSFPSGPIAEEMIERMLALAEADIRVQEHRDQLQSDIQIQRGKIRTDIELKRGRIRGSAKGVHRASRDDADGASS